jgi:neutral ceramidase
MSRALALLVVLASLALFAAPAHAGTLRAGVGRADITPPTGYFMLGWARGDARIAGQSTRLYARVLVLERDGRKVALVSEDLNSIPGGMVVQAIARVAALGYTERNVVVSASHTHGGPSGFSNFNFKNTVNPTPKAPDAVESSPDPALYAFMVRRLAEAIRRADANLRPAVAAWGGTSLLGVTRNRSLEAHLADHGIDEPPGKGSVSQDPKGYPHTIAPEVAVLRVDQVVGKRRVPVAAWSQFADHGTVNKAEFPFYNADHNGVADRVVEAAIRRAGRVPASQAVVNVYGNTTAGDVSAGLDRSGPAAADEVGRREAAAMLAAWREAGKRLTASPALDVRWTRVCFCGQAVDGGTIDSKAVFGAPYFTGSEEGRGPLFDATGKSLEGEREPVGIGPQGNKIPTRTDVDGTMVPTAVPLLAVRVGDRAIVTAPGEMTVELGRRTKGAALSALAGSGVREVVIAGYANEYASYFTTPEEFGAQHYEGGTTLYGRLSGSFIAERIAGLAGTLGSGAPAPDAAPFDPTRGLEADGPLYPPGAASGTAASQPRAVARLARAAFSWRGAAAGLDRPLDRPFVTVERRDGKRWRGVADDLGLEILWSVKDDKPFTAGNPSFAPGATGTTTATWQVPLDAVVGRYRFVVTATRYRLVSSAFAVGPSRRLVATVKRSGSASTITLAYPPPVVNADLTSWPAAVTDGVVDAVVGGAKRRVVIRRGRAVVRSGVVRVPAGAARDRYGNANGITEGP